jgi:hypothetical protein
MGHILGSPNKQNRGRTCVPLQCRILVVMFAERTAAQALTTFAAEANLKDHGLETQLLGKKFGKSLALNSVPKFDPKFGVISFTSLISSH